MFSSCKVCWLLQAYEVPIRCLLDLCEFSPQYSFFPQFFSTLLSIFSMVLILSQIVFFSFSMILLLPSWNSFFLCTILFLGCCSIHLYMLFHPFLCTPLLSTCITSFNLLLLFFFFLGVTPSLQILPTFFFPCVGSKSKLQASFASFNSSLS